MRRILAALAMVSLAALVGSGCLVLSLDHFYDDASITFDERLVGAWKDADDNLTVTVERSEWRSYRITYVHATDSGTLTGYLFGRNGIDYLDLSAVRGEDPGPFLIVGHAAARVTVDENAVVLSPLSFDRFREAIDSHALADLDPVRSERDQIVLGGSGVVVREWLGARAADDPAFGPRVSFARVPVPPVPPTPAAPATPPS